MVSTIPTVLIGYQCKRLVVRSASSHMFSGIGILLTGVILLVVDYSNVNGSKGTKETSFGDAMWMGICQGLSVFPGLSRLGLTMSAGLFCGLGRKFAVKYSFIMSIPAILGAMVLELKDFADLSVSGMDITCYIVGMVIAAVIGYICIKTMLVIVRNRKFRVFAIYCLIVGLISIGGFFYTL